MRVGRARILRVAVCGICIGAAWIFHAQNPLSGADYRPGTPFAYLFDTGTSSPAAPTAKALAAKANWTLVPEDELRHRFAGDVVLLNDKLAIVVRVKGPGAEVYSQTAAGWRQRAVLVPLPADGRSVAGLSAVKIIENHPGAVTVDATLRTAAEGRVSVRFRLTTGQQMLEVQPGQRADRLVVRCEPRYVVVPDFFGDDMVFGPEVFGNEAFDRPRFGLPTENFFLNLLDGGDAMLMCVWRDGREGADALLPGDGRRRAIGGCEVQCGKDKSVWIALMENAGIWQQRTISAEKTAEGNGPDWKLPFAAKWRADWVRPDGVARSWNLDDANLDDANLDDANLDDPEQNRPSAVPRAGPILVYPIDRTRETPLTAFCPTDVLRNTLGLGPCQYILETEGLDAESDLTADRAIGWVERQFQRKKGQEAAEQIKQCLARMTDHLRRAQARIEQYAAFARQVRELCRAQKLDGGPSDAVETLSRSARRLEAIVASGAGAMAPARRAEALAGEIVGLIGRQDALAGCQRLGVEIQRIGAVQDRTLSKCRMAVRWLKQQARVGAAADPRADRLAKEVRARAEALLRNQEESAGK